MKIPCRTTLTLLALCSLLHAERYAVLVGNTTGDAHEAPLKYVDKDLNALSKVLSDLCGFKQENVQTLFNATPGAVDQTLDQISRRIHNSSGEHLFLFFYTGHADESNLKLGDQRYALARLKEQLSTLPAQIRIGIFDACQSGAFTRLKGGRLAEPFLFLSDEKVRGQVILSSSSPHESSQESDILRSSVFTFHLINGLRGSADASGEGQVTLSEVYQYAYNHTVATTARSTGPTQHPSYQFSIQGEGEIVLADISVKSRGILLNRTIEGAISIIDSRGTLVADFTKSGDGNTLIAVNSGTYQITRQTGGTTLTASATVAQDGITTIDDSHFTSLGHHPRMRSKGERPERTHINLSAGASYLRWDLSSLNQRLHADFSPYRSLGITTHFKIPHGRVMGTASVDLWLRGRTLISVGYGYTNFIRSAVYSGSQTGLDGQQNTITLNFDQRMDLHCIILQSGFRPPSGRLRNVSLCGGLMVNAMRHTTSATVTDQVYEYTQHAGTRHQGAIATPVVRINYHQSLPHNTELRFTIGYRHQSSARTPFSPFSFSSAIPPNPAYGSAERFKYRLGGLDAGISLSIRSGGR